MSRFADYLFSIALTLWVGALWAIGAIAAPTLFYGMSDHGLAAVLAGRQFAIVAWLGIGCATYLLIYLFFREGLHAFRSASLWLILLMLLLTLAGHFGVTPVIEQLRIGMAREVAEGVLQSRFNTWHGIASVLWLLQSVMGITLVTQAFKR